MMNKPTRTPESEAAPESLPDGDASFMSRWSRRKAAARQPAVEATKTGEVEATAPPAVTPVDEPAADRATASVDESDLPPLESLDADSDYRGFLSPRVSEKLQRLALRKLFLSGGFNVRDGLDDYDDDFTQFEPLGNIITADMRHQQEVEAEREAHRRLAQSEAEAEVQPDAVQSADRGVEQDLGPTEHTESVAGEQPVVEADGESNSPDPVPMVDDDSDMADPRLAGGESQQGGSPARERRS